MPRRAALIATAALTLALQACVVVPRSTMVYDEACQTHSRQLVLQVEEVGLWGGCANDGCVTLLIAAGVVTAASAVISGSIVVVDNIVTWFERRAQCRP